jgi:hypothetical protein
MAGRLRRTVVAVSLVALLLPLAAATSLADTGPAPTEVFKFSSNGYSAQAEESQCTDPVDDIVTCTFTFISVFSGNRREHGSGAIHGTEVCYSTGTDAFNQVTGEGISSIQEFGCTTDVGEGTVIERDLSGATIAPTTIALEGFSCDEIECGPTGEFRDATVEGIFTATSAVFRQSNRNVFDDGICIFRDSSRGTSRRAMFSGTVDGQPLELGDPENGFAQIMQGTFSSSSKCAIEA